MAQGIDLADLMEQFKTIGAAEASVRKEMDINQANLDTASSMQVEAIRREASLRGQVQSAVDQIQLDKAADNQKSAAEFGTNQHAQSYVLGELSQLQIAKTRELLQSAADIKAKREVGFSDNPIEWLMNQFTLPRDVYAHNVTASELDTVETTIAKLQAQTESSVRINNAIQANTSVDIMRLNAERLKAQAEAEVEKTRFEAAKTNIHTASVRLATNQQAFANVLALNRAQIDLQQLQISQAHLELSRQMQQERLKELEEKHKSDELLQQDLDRATAVLGYRKLTPQQFRNMAGPMRAALEQAMADPNVDQGRISSNPVTSATLANTFNFPLTPEKQRIKNYITDMMIAAEKANPTWAALKPEQKQSAYLTAVNSEINRQLNNIPDQGSMFSAPPLKSVGSIPAVAATQLWKENLAPLAKSDMTVTSAQQVFDTAVKAVSEGKMTLQQATSDVSTIYQAIVADNWHNRDYGTFSIKVAPEYRTSYNTRIEAPSFLGRNSQSTDMTNPTAVQNAILRVLNQGRMRAAEMGALPTSPTSPQPTTTDVK